VLLATSGVCKRSVNNNDHEVTTDIAQQHYRQVAEMVTQGNATSSPPSRLVLINS
ncbi:hypothetical protein HYPSUDRAFT_45514, partial [Hypholoma sublateritium FD-334 SS-4]